MVICWNIYGRPAKAIYVQKQYLGDQIFPL